MRSVQGSVVDNRYDVVRALGSGGMGEVYLARDRTLGRDVALKVLRSQYANDRESAERFKREAMSAARLSHPNIVQVYDRGDTGGGSSYIAMEYVPGDTLKDRIREEGALDPGLAASYGYQVAEALGAAHARGVVHRDIKPQNVLITSSGGAKVADFGIARAASAASDSRTETGTVMGTAGYMSPEQALGRPATPKSDLYSLGVVLYEAVTGNLPFTAENPVAVSMKHVNEAPVPPREANPAVPDGLNAVITRLLSKDPEDRYPDAEALAEDLWRARRGLAPAAAIPQEAETVETPTRPPAPTTRQAARQPAAARRKRSKAPFVLAGLLLLLGLLGLGWALAGGSGPDVEVPSVEGLPRDQAVSRLQDAGFRTEVQTREGVGGAAGTVADQSPGGGRRAPDGSTVTLTVAAGASAVSVPEVVGLGFADAQATLEGAGLAVGSTSEVPSETAAEGVVVEQGVGAGADAQPGTPVDLVLSSGPPAQGPTTPSPAPASPAPDPASPPAEEPASPAPSDDAPDPNPGGAPAQTPAGAPDGQPEPEASPSSPPASAPAQPAGGEAEEGEDE